MVRFPVDVAYLGGVFSIGSDSNGLCKAANLVEHSICVGSIGGVCHNQPQDQLFGLFPSKESVKDNVAGRCD
jgi:hypothetical protein